MAILDDADQSLGYYLEPHVIGIHCPVVAGSPDCGQQFIVYFSMSVPRANLVVARRPEGPRVVGLQMGDTLEKLGALAFHSGELPYVDDEVGPGWFYPWRGEYLPDPEHDVARRWLLAPPETTGVMVEPAFGECPATLTLTLQRAPSSEPGKEPLAESGLLPGAGIQHTTAFPVGPPLVKQKPRALGRPLIRGPVGRGHARWHALRRRDNHADCLGWRRWTGGWRVRDRALAPPDPAHLS